MSVSDDGISRRSFLERVALAAGLTAAGELLENLNPEAATAAATMSSSAAALVNSGAVAWPLLSDPKSDAPANLITNPNILMMVRQKNSWADLGSGSLPSE